MEKCAWSNLEYCSIADENYLLYEYISTFRTYSFVVIYLSSDPADFETSARFYIVLTPPVTSLYQKDNKKMEEKSLFAKGP